MNNISYISVKSAINEYLKQVDPDDEIDRTRLKSFANSTARQFSIANIQDIKVSAIPVINYGATLTDDFDDVVLILYKEKQTKCTPRYEVIEWAQKCFGSDCVLKITKECPKCHDSSTCDCGFAPITLNATQNWKDLHGFENYSGSKFYTDGKVIGSPYNNTTKKSSSWKLLHRTTNNFNNLKHDLNDNCNYPDTSCRAEYDIRDRRIITSFKEGEILLSYLGNRIDDDGYYMIPDHPDAISAVVYSIIASDALRMYSKAPSQTTRVYWSDMTNLYEATLTRALQKLNVTPYDKLKASLKTYWSSVITTFYSEYNTGKYRRDQYNPDNWKT